MRRSLLYVVLGGSRGGSGANSREAALDEVQEQGVGRLQRGRQLLGAGPSFLPLAVCDVPGVPLGVCATPTTSFHSEQPLICCENISRTEVRGSTNQKTASSWTQTGQSHWGAFQEPGDANGRSAQFNEATAGAALGWLYLHDAGDLLHLTLPREERVAGVELGQDAAQTPHVDGHAVRVTQDDLRGAVEATLDVGVH